MIGSSNVAGSFLIFSYKLLRTNIPIANVCKAFASSLSANIILSKIQLSTKITKSGLPLIKNVLQTLSKIALTPSG